MIKRISLEVKCYYKFMKRFFRMDQLKYLYSEKFCTNFLMLLDRPGALQRFYLIKFARTLEHAIVIHKLSSRI